MHIHASVYSDGQDVPAKGVVLEYLLVICGHTLLSILLLLENGV